MPEAWHRSFADRGPLAIFSVSRWIYVVAGYQFFNSRPWRQSVQEICPLLAMFWWTLEICLLVSKSVKAACALVFTDLVGNLCVLSWFGPDLFQRIEPLLSTFRRVGLESHWNALLEPDIDGRGEKSATSNPDVKPCSNNQHREAMWTWTNSGRSASVVLSSYLDRVLVS